MNADHGAQAGEIGDLGFEGVLCGRGKHMQSDVLSRRLLLQHGLKPGLITFGEPAHGADGMHVPACIGAWSESAGVPEDQRGVWNGGDGTPSRVRINRERMWDGKGVIKSTSEVDALKRHLPSGRNNGRSIGERPHIDMPPPSKHGDIPPAEGLLAGEILHLDGRGERAKRGDDDLVKGGLPGVAVRGAAEEDHGGRVARVADMVQERGAGVGEVVDVGGEGVVRDDDNAPREGRGVERLEPRGGEARRLPGEHAVRVGARDAREVGRGAAARRGERQEGGRDGRAHGGRGRDRQARRREAEAREDAVRARVVRPHRGRGRDEDAFRGARRGERGVGACGRARRERWADRTVQHRQKQDGERQEQHD